MDIKTCQSPCPCTCSECFLLGDTIADWAQRKECKKLENKLKMMVAGMAMVAGMVEIR
jgi:hypothetical protein